MNNNHKTNNKLTVITVTKNNKVGLIQTIESLSNTKVRPKQIIIIDGMSTDGTQDLDFLFSSDLPIMFISERDDGIYDAMNKAKKLVSTELVHYLNAGDTVSENIYSDCDSFGIFKVKILDNVSAQSWFDYIKLSGFGFCHQGIVFNSNHPIYDLAYKYAADFKLICEVFPDGLYNVKVFNNGYCQYMLGGVSSINNIACDKEILIISFAKFGFSFVFLKIYFYIKFKYFVPRFLRRFLSATIRKG
jgi:glycosyltransferase involved in cell wall biosynthesis